MSEYSEQFEDGENSSGGQGKATYRLKLSVDVRSAKDFREAANAFVQFSVKLQDKFHKFKSEQPSAIRQGPSESKLTGSFATYEFLANKP